MERYYYISDNLAELEIVEQELENNGIATEQIHVLSQNDREVATRRLHSVTSFMKKDIVHSTIIGCIVGVCLSILVLLGAWLSGWPDRFTWVPFIFLSIIVLGFCTWEGGLWGIQEPNHQFKRFQKVLDHGKHVLFVDIDHDQMEALEAVSHAHPRLKNVGKGTSTPKMLVRTQQWFHRFMRWAP
jgi:hypothetical protein